MENGNGEKVARGKGRGRRKMRLLRNAWVRERGEVKLRMLERWINAL